MNHSQLAHEYHMKGYNCSQSLLAAFSDVTGLSETESLSVSGCFGRGRAPGSCAEPSPAPLWCWEC